MKDRFYSERPELEGRMKYEKRIVAFLDILGFKNLVNETAHIEKFAGFLSFAAKINSTVQASRGILSAEQRFFYSPLPYSVNIISDSIVISKAFDDTTINYAFCDIINLVATLFDMCLQQNIIFRGAITDGDLYCEDNVVFGPAMVEAYLLEEKKAVNPRCVIADDLCERIHLDGRGEQMMRRDSDSIMYLDTIYYVLANHCYQPDNSIDNTILYLRDLIILNLQKETQSAEEEKIKSKYMWMKERFNQAIDRLELNENVSLRKFFIS